MNEIMIILSRNFDCNTCVKDIQAFLNVILDEETARQLIEVISGPTFCADPYFGLNEEHVQECVNQVKGFIPVALTSLFQNYPPESACETYFGVCTSPNLHSSFDNLFVASSLDSDCEDNWRTKHCQRRKDKGKCNKRIVKKNCQKTCGFCEEDPEVPEE